MYKYGQSAKISTSDILNMEKLHIWLMLMQVNNTTLNPKTISKKTCNMHYIGQGINPYPTAFPYGNGMVLHFYQQQESSTTKTVHKVINKGLKTYV